MVLNKTWRLIFNPVADRQFTKLEKQLQKRILDFFEDLLRLPNPKSKALPLKGNIQNFWRFRIGDYRVICRFEDDEMLIVAVKVAHRREVYL